VCIKLVTWNKTSVYVYFRLKWTILDIAYTRVTSLITLARIVVYLSFCKEKFKFKFLKNQYLKKSFIFEILIYDVDLRNKYVREHS